MAQDKKCYDCIVIGGGASGMMAAITAAGCGADVAIIEHTKRLGNKILQTGNGKCNFTNRYMDLSMYQNEDKEFVKNVISRFDSDNVIEFFRRLGVYVKERNGYVYPHSETAASVNDALRLEVENQKITVYAECEVLAVRKKTEFGAESEKGGFAVKTTTGSLYARKLILATGSKAAPKSGSDGSGYELARQLGHKIKKPLPALVQLVSSNPYCKAMAGVRSTGTARLYIDGTFAAEDTGEIQYTDYGISGIPVFQLSRHAVLALDKGRSVNICVNMLNDIYKETLYQDIESRFSKSSSKTVEQYFSGIVNKKLVYAAGKTANVDVTKTVAETKTNELRKIVDVLACFKFDITGSKGFDQAQVCQGGVRLSDVDGYTLESKMCPELYFAGEILDVDGKCGGYNLQWAWSSGYVAGVNASGANIGADAEGINAADADTTRK